MKTTVRGLRPQMEMTVFLWSHRAEMHSMLRLGTVMGALVRVFTPTREMHVSPLTARIVGFTRKLRIARRGRCYRKLSMSITSRVSRFALRLLDWRGRLLRLHRAGGRQRAFSSPAGKGMAKPEHNSPRRQTKLRIKSSSFW